MNSARDAIVLSGARMVRDEGELIADLVVLLQLLEKWQKVQNLVSRETLGDFWTRHVADSLQLVKWMPDQAPHVVDLGSGGGFPALPLAICFKDTGAKFTLVESNSRKVAFLRAVTRELKLPVHVLDKRIDSIVSRETGQVDVFTARALAPLSKLCGFIHPLWSPQSRALFHKGREHVEESRESDAYWHHDVLKHKSAVDPQGVVIELTSLRQKKDA